MHQYIKFEAKAWLCNLATAFPFALSLLILKQPEELRMHTFISTIHREPEE